MTDLRKEYEEKESVLNLELENSRASLSNSEENVERINKQLKDLKEERETINDEAMRCMSQVEEAAQRESEVYELRITRLEAKIEEFEKKNALLKIDIQEADKATQREVASYEDKLLNMEESVLTVEQECDRLRRELYECERKYDDFVESEKRKQKQAATSPSSPNNDMKKIYESRIAAHVKKYEEQVICDKCVNFDIIFYE